MSQSCLGSGKRYLRVKDVNSNQNNIEVGFPQGFRLGPILLLVYANDVRLHNKELQCCNVPFSIVLALVGLN